LKSSSSVRSAERNSGKIATGSRRSPISTKNHQILTKIGQNRHRLASLGEKQKE
jgi:hypothetical protein